MKSSRSRAFFAGLLTANSAPHLATAIAGHTHLTPLAGRTSGAVANGVWAGLNLAGAVTLLLLNPSSRRKQKEATSWDGDLPAFEAGFLLFAAWMSVSESTMRVNWKPRD